MDRRSIWGSLGFCRNAYDLATSHPLLSNSTDIWCSLGAFIDVDMGVAESIASNKWYILFFVLFVYWGAICVALRGVGIFSQVSKWCGIIGTIIPAIILVILGFSYLWFSGKPAGDPISWGDLSLI
ncbi:putative glutamate:gamma-aminobutyrate antiporter [Escherichia coli]|uniref:Putative glutamate:gamma-aminobutyrate antiporter n=1 Tax=Escherichia coli TaxID=562 RepID=A0A377C7W6_ECOLX|nr:putative glutamate:gamma-aminobutyrate antiporter [Escherichia coli]